MHISKGGYPVTLLPPPRRLAPSVGLGTTWVRQLRSGSCHYPTAATKCNQRPSRATANPVGGKACSSTKGGLLRYILNTYSIHKVSSLKFAYFQGRLSRHTNEKIFEYDRQVFVIVTFVIYERITVFLLRLKIWCHYDLYLQSNITRFSLKFNVHLRISWINGCYNINLSMSVSFCKKTNIPLNSLSE